MSAEATTTSAAAIETASPEATDTSIEALETVESTEDGSNESTPEQKAVEFGKDDPKSKTTAPTKKALEAQKKNIKKLNLKIDGKEEAFDLDLDNEDELRNHVQFSRVAQKRMQEAAQMKQEISQFLDVFQKNPEVIFAQLGLDAEDFAVKTLQKKLEDSQKSPQQIELEKAQKELNELRAAQKRAEDERRGSELSRLQAEQEQKIESGMIAALEKHNLKNEPLVVKRMAEIMLTALDNKIDLSPDDIAPLVKKELNDDMSAYIKAMPDEALESLLGKERLTGMRKKQVAAIKKAGETASSIKSTGNDNKPKDTKTEKKSGLKMTDFLK